MCVVLIACISLFSCRYQDVSISNIGDFGLKHINDKGVQVDFSIKISNPNSFAIKINKSKLNILLNHVKLGNAHLSKKIVLPRHSNKVYHLSLIADNSQLGKAAIPALLGLVMKKGLPVEINGFIKGKAFVIFSKKVPVEYKDVINVFGK